MTKLSKLGVFIAVIFILSSAMFTACRGTTGTTPATTNSTNVFDTTNRVEVILFSSPDNCACMKYAQSLIETTISTSYKANTDTGVLVYKVYNPDDPANADLKKQFGATSLSLYFSDVHGTVVNTKEYIALWFYLDSTLADENLKTRFVSLLKKEIDKHLSEL
jgi:hypothetical protein